MAAVFTTIVILGVLYLFLIAPRMFHKPDRTPLYGYHYAHRGLFDNETEAPENSLPAFQKAVEAGYGIEFDVQLSKDDKLVVFHDATLRRMCGVEGNVWDYTLEELKTFKLANSEAMIPTLEEALTLVDGKVPLVIEYKLDRIQTKVCALSNELLKEYKGTYCIESFYPHALGWYRKHRPDVVRGQLSQEHFRLKEHKGKVSSWVASFLLTNVWARPDFVAYNEAHTSNISRRVFRAMGGLSIAYTIKSKTRYEELKNDYDLFIFDSCRLD